MTTTARFLLRAGLCIALFGVAAPYATAAPPPPLRLQPIVSEHGYEYMVKETQAGRSGSGYVMDFRLRVARGGVVMAVVTSATVVAGDTRTPVAIDPACLRALHARRGELAEIRLAPLTPEQAKLGEAFMPFCAPAALFLPMTDILNVALVQTSKRFQIGRLTTVGQSVGFQGFTTSLDRPGMQMAESSDGGVTTLAGVEGENAIVLWAPSPSQLHLVQKDGAGPGKPVSLDGTEHFAFRLEIDTHTGVLQRASSVYDDLNVAVTMAGLPPGIHPRQLIHREVTIEPLAH